MVEWLEFLGYAANGRWFESLTSQPATNRFVNPAEPGEHFESGTGTGNKRIELDRVLHISTFSGILS